jgi:hypothetical protein
MALQTEDGDFVKSPYLYYDNPQRWYVSATSVDLSKEWWPCCDLPHEGNDAPHYLESEPPDYEYMQIGFEGTRRVYGASVAYDVWGKFTGAWEETFTIVRDGGIYMPGNFGYGVSFWGGYTLVSWDDMPDLSPLPIYADTIQQVVGHSRFPLYGEGAGTQVIWRWAEKPLSEWPYDIEDIDTGGGPVPTRVYRVHFGKFFKPVFMCCGQIVPKVSVSAEYLSFYLRPFNRPSWMFVAYDFLNIGDPTKLTVLGDTFDSSNTKDATQPVGVGFREDDFDKQKFFECMYVTTDERGQNCRCGTMYSDGFSSPSGSPNVFSTYCLHTDVGEEPYIMSKVVRNWPGGKYPQAKKVPAYKAAQVIMQEI